MMSRSSLLALLALGSSLGVAQFAPAIGHNTGFNSSFKLTPAQIAEAQLDEVLVESIEIIMDFERSQLAFGGPREDDFYSLPVFTNETIPTKPGQLLKSQPVTDPTAYALPPNTVLSRIMYTTTDFNGTIIPATGFILWPYTPRQVANDSNSASAAIWFHGTSSFFAPQAPSAHRSLWYDHNGPFALAQAGYAVFAPDFAGLGVRTSWDGSEIIHEYGTHPSASRDGLYGFRAALEAFPKSLDINFVAIGHSQGGGAAWALAEALASQEADFEDLLAGYRGTIAVSPATDPVAGPPLFMLPAVGQGLSSIFPAFELSDWLTTLGVARVNLGREIEAGNGVWQQLMLSLSEDAMVSPDFNETWYYTGFQNLASNGQRDFKGPLLVVQGSDDILVTYNVTKGAVEKTWDQFPDQDLEFLVANGVGHTPVLSATKHVWLQWVGDRLNGKPLKKRGNVRTDLDPMLPIENYLAVANSFPLWAGLPEYAYEVPLAV